MALFFSIPHHKLCYGLLPWPYMAIADPLAAARSLPGGFLSLLELEAERTLTSALESTRKQRLEFRSQTYNRWTCDGLAVAATYGRLFHFPGRSRVSGTLGLWSRTWHGRNRGCPVLWAFSRPCWCPVASGAWASACRPKRLWHVGPWKGCHPKVEAWWIRACGPGKVAQRGSSSVRRPGWPAFRPLVRKASCRWEVQCGGGPLPRPHENVRRYWGV